MPEFVAEYPNGRKQLFALNVDDANEKAFAVYGSYPNELHTVEDRYGQA